MPSHEPVGQKRILIVDDEPALLKMMSIYLQRRGFSVKTCDTTGEAAALSQAHPDAFEVAVLDATMPGLSVDELALQMLARSGAVRVLVDSGYLIDMSILEAAAPGRVAFLHKPFTPEMLALAVERMIAPEKEKEV
ncbi:MAG: response regulator [Acidobacteriia bacterium]|nr:response regulator [Terriglobia bacterium]